MAYSLLHSLELNRQMYEAEEMKFKSNQHIREVLEVARQLIILADQGDLDSMDDGCPLLNGIIRDCAYKIRAQAEREREIHKEKGIWDTGENTKK